MTDISGSNTVSDGSNGLYTPTTEEVRESYVLMQKCSAYPNPDAEFDRWFAEVKAQAWQDGIEAFDAAITRDVDDPWSQLPENPYRQGENSD